MERPINLFENEMLFWKYQKEKYAVRIEKDPDPCDPRDPRLSSDSFVMICMEHPLLELGDYRGKKKKSTGQFLKDLVESECGKTEMLQKMSEKDMQDYILKTLKHVNKDPAANLDEMLTGTQDIDPIARLDFASNLIRENTVILPIWIYEGTERKDTVLYAGTDRPYPFCDGMGWFAGYAAVRKKDVEDNIPKTAKDLGWEKAAETIISLCIGDYSYYLSGQVYGYKLYTLDGDMHPYDPAKCAEMEGGDWTLLDGETGFYGPDLLTNGMCRDIGLGLMEAVKSGKASFGKALPKKKTETTWIFGCKQTNPEIWG